MTTSSKISSLRDIVESAKRAGLIAGPGEAPPARAAQAKPARIATPVKKDGVDVATIIAGVRSQWMEVSPAMATKWLQNNFRNRPIDDDVVIAYARDMANGVWVPTHQGVAFNDRDELIDGQHRLHAIIRSGRTLRMMVTFGLASKIVGHEMTTMDAVDRGRTRSVADQLKIQHNFAHGALAASMSRTLAAICFQQRTKRLSVGQTIDIIRAFEQPMQWVILHRPREHGLRAVGVLAAFTFALATVPAEQLQDCSITQAMQRLFTQTDLLPNHPMQILLNFLVSPEAQLLNRSSDRGLTELVLNAIHLEEEGARCEKLTMSSEGANYFRDLQPDRVAKVAAMFALPKLPV